MLMVLDVGDSINALYMIYCTSLLPLCVLGIALFYSGLTQRRSSFTMLALPMLLVPLIFIDWFIWGYSLCYSSSSNRFIGNLNFAVLRHVRESITLIYSTPRGDILSLNHFLFNGLFKIVCAGLTFPGCIAERGRIIPMLVFLFFWSCIIYNPVTYWFWNRHGWLSVELDHLPVLDFAGGNCIHIVSGFTTLAYSYILGPRNPKILYNYRNSNSSFIIIGTFFLLCGWIGFVGGCDFKFSTNSLYIFVNTAMAAFVSGIVWTLIDFYFSSIPLEGEVEDTTSEEHKLSLYPTRSNLGARVSQTGVMLNQHLHESKSNFVQRRKFSMISFCSGIMTGLVVITPAGGYTASPTEFWKPFVFGVVGAILGNLATRLKYFFKIDDALDIFAIHGVAGIVGSILTGIFSNKLYDSHGGWVTGHWVQIGYQLLGCVVTSAYVFVMTCVLLYIIDLIPGLHLRIDKDFNRRIRESLKPKPEEDTESQLSPTGFSHGHNEHTEVSFWERAELFGSDSYEFNGEYSMDFMEFMKVIRPQDFESEELDGNSFGEEFQPTGVVGGSYELHEENNLIKRG